MSDRVLSELVSRTYKGSIDHDVAQIGSWANVAFPQCKNNGTDAKIKAPTENLRYYTSEASKSKESKIASEMSYEGYQMERWGEESKKEGPWTPAQFDLDEKRENSH